MNDSSNPAPIATREDLILHLQDMLREAREGDLQTILRFCNSRTRKQDVQVLLARELSVDEARDLLNSPEHMVHPGLREVNTLALELQRHRARCRKLLRTSRVDALEEELRDCIRLLEDI